MPRFNRQFGIDSSLPSTGESAAYSRLSQSLDQFGATADRIGANFVAADARRDAAQLEPSTEAPELHSPATVYGSNYNDIVLKGHLAATQNEMTRHVTSLASQFSTDPAGFAGAANEIRGEYLNGVAPEARSAAAVSFDKFSNNYLMDIQAKQVADQTAASMLEQKEGLSNIRNTALDSLRRGDEAGYMELARVYDASLAGSSLTEAEKVQGLISFKRDSNLAVSMGEIRESLNAGDFESAIEHIQAVRDGRIPMVYNDTGMTSEDAADYLQAQFTKYVGDFEAELDAETTMEKLEDVKLAELRENTRNDGYDLAADGALTLEWVKAHREELDNEYGEFIKLATAHGGTFADVDPDPGAYIDLMNRSAAGEDVKPEAEQALLSNEITKQWYDQITKQVENKRSGVADKYINEALRADLNMGAFAKARNAEALAQWEEFKMFRPDATREDLMAEARNIVTDTVIVGEALTQHILPKPRHVVFTGPKKDIDINATRQATMRAYMAELPEGTTPIQARIMLANDPAFQQQSELIDQWEETLARMVEVQ